MANPAPTPIEAGGAEPLEAAPKLVPAVESAVRILMLLSDLGRPARLTDISRALSLNPSTCLNILRTLATFDFVSADQSTKSYTLGFGIGKLTTSALTKAQAFAAVETRMRDYSIRNNATVTVWEQEDEDHMLLILQTVGRGILSLSFKPGQRLPLLIGAMGRVMAGHGGLPRKTIKARFDKLRWQGPIPFEDYMLQAQAAVERGWAIDEGHYARSVTTISVPLRTADGSVRRVCSATFLVPSLDPGDRITLVAELRTLGKAVEELLLPY
jgi:DNA-binding IclR family transcriptional regulator